MTVAQSLEITKTRLHDVARLEHLSPLAGTRCLVFDLQARIPLASGSVRLAARREEQLRDYARNGLLAGLVPNRSAARRRRPGR
jgi:hypothetical protein